MNARGARQKGAKFDKEVAERLSIWYFGEEYRDALMRTHGSRGRKGFKDQVGDLGIARGDLPKLWIFGVENKARDRRPGPKRKGLQKPAWTIDDILQDGKSAPIFSYWKQCVDEAKRGKKLPLMVLKRNYHRPIVGVHEDDFAFVVDQCSLRWSPRMVLYAPRRMALLRLDLFLQSDPSAWEQRWKERYGHS